MLLTDAADDSRAVPQTGAGILHKHALTQLQMEVEASRGVVVVSLFVPLFRRTLVAVVSSLLPALSERAVMSGHC